AILDLADSCLQADPAHRPTASEIEYELHRARKELMWRRSLALLLGALAASTAMTTAVDMRVATVPSTSSVDSVVVDVAALAATANGAFAAWYTQQFRENETQLLGLASDSLKKYVPDADRPCGGLPSVQTRSTALQPNGQCPPSFTALNASCTCMDAYSASLSTWEFRVKKKASANAQRKTLAPSGVLEIDAIATLWVDERLTELSIEGISEEPLPIKFVPDNRVGASNDLPIVKSTAIKVNVQKLRLSNIDLDEVIRKTANFIPSSVTDLTIHNCNFKDFGIDFARSLAAIEYLDFSSNKLPFPYVGKTLSPDCYLCRVREANLSHNNFSELTEDLFKVPTLKKLYVEGNPLNFRVSPMIFQGIANLEAFTSNVPDASVACDRGKWKTAHGVRFCVLLDASSAGVSSAETSGESTSYLVYVAIGGGAVILVLAFFVVREKWWHAIEKTCKDDSQSIFAETYDFDKSASTLDVNLITDPMVLTNRIPYGEVKLGKCISQGGFGL
ncbi:hypothetical protein PybrP1_002892, partial [[Pythium] brassicae (nom. inval.)]